MIEPDALWVPPGLFRPARFTDKAVHIPLDELNVMLREQCIERRKHPFPHIIPCEIEYQLVARLGARAMTKMVHPIRMRTVEITVRIDHLWFYP